MSAIFSILSAILHIGNVDFLEKEVKHQTTTIIGDTDLIQIGESCYASMFISHYKEHVSGIILVSDSNSVVASR